MTDSPFSETLRNATWGDHSEAEAGIYLKELMAGRLSPEVYGEMIAQHYFAYVALDGAGRALADDPVAAPFVLPEIFREEALVRDLTTVYGPSWRDRITPSKSTLTLVARLNQMADWPGGYVAHHYTRYLGDMSGGQFIRMELQKIYGYQRGGGVDFYYFDIGSLPRFKQEYRGKLDAMPIGDDEKQRIIRETRLAYQLNTEVLTDLGRALRTETAA
ncbi:biliverdin-producing heme oxygenase [Sinosporangium siamense]|uniref:Biliverdin-producing heme oxygenase n=1 Tax=Sinosporangium siamense TaxID=1367973 RepID=A0A919VD31_9ACTN|nr:biliverdin-producing heme oxygenase [Sinosporangium siamense]GII93724.1 biliverdin-producing heme oxygenase [Sinosporangium siamense]